ncbi:MAG: hypothetical protein EON48_15580, partial [Acetobacteraceae bacterium]
MRNLPLLLATCTMLSGCGLAGTALAQPKPPPLGVEPMPPGGKPPPLVGPQSLIRVGTGSVADAAITATIAADLIGNTQLVKTDGGTLVLSGTNRFTGGV